MKISKGKREKAREEISRLSMIKMILLIFNHNLISNSKLDLCKIEMVREERNKMMGHMLKEEMMEAWKERITKTI